MNLNEVNQGIHRFKKGKRLGRGTGSGTGKTSGRGHKGQRSRAGHSQHPSFQGGAMPMFRRIPKRGFHNQFALKVAEINVGQLDRHFDDGEDVDPQRLQAESLTITQFDVVKILGDGELNKKLKVSAHRFSESAKQKITKAGGEVIELPGTKAVPKNKQKQASS